MSMSNFKDHFSTVANDYARYRPRYPEALFTYLRTQVPAGALAWDCGCGNGQASVALARIFDRVIATDPSAPQIKAAEHAAGITYAVAPAENAAMVPAGKVNLIIAAQAAHWFDLPKFYDEVSRVASPKALIALVSYRPTKIEDLQANATLQYFYKDIMGSYWPPERQHVDEGYANLYFPFSEEEGPDLKIQAEWTLQDLTRYIGTWSATKEYKRINNTDPALMLTELMSKSWPDPNDVKRITWPLACRIGRLP